MEETNQDRADLSPPSSSFPRPFFHDRNYMGALRACAALGTSECPTELIGLDDLDELSQVFVGGLGTYEYISRLDAVLVDQEWINSDGDPINCTGW